MKGWLACPFCSETFWIPVRRWHHELKEHVLGGGSHVQPPSGAVMAVGAPPKSGADWHRVSANLQEARVPEESRPEMTTGRTRLMVFGWEILAAMADALRDPKNTSKGDDFASLGWMELEELILDEIRESRELSMQGDHEGAIREMGDALVYMGMQLKKGGSR